MEGKGGCVYRINGVRILLYGCILDLTLTLTLAFLSITTQPLRFFNFSCPIIRNRDDVDLGVAKITNPAFQKPTTEI